MPYSNEQTWVFLHRTFYKQSWRHPESSPTALRMCMIFFQKCFRVSDIAQYKWVYLYMTCYSAGNNLLPNIDRRDFSVTNDTPSHAWKSSNAMTKIVQSYANSEQVRLLHFSYNGNRTHNIKHSICPAWEKTPERTSRKKRKRAMGRPLCVKIKW